MSLFVLNEQLWFPPVTEADEDGLLAVGGDLNPERILYAYQQGIFPWYSEEIPLWWSPDPRFVLFPNKLYISKSMRTLLKRNAFKVTTNQAFTQVINACGTIERPGQDGTWLNADMQQAYMQLHQMGYAHSVEAWYNNTLVGGLYGLRIGQVFFGESMFSTISNASKYAFISFVQQLQTEGVQLIDCQVYTDHLASLGATMIPRNDFIQYLRKWLPNTV
ncbi:MAG TPA: leucyl/phenylalanyl-tRNA--protein transferase [Chitinophagaceae bacterium]|nr:leucyl/phenylalanyl-tRNA--protein transferase [Chitinophagaceae bacterium]HAN38791.1 leucyl/phenylalanyl-tRNA--protein transferase [Chitinophagaceae bacterium]